jgi:hypothetical protein
MKIALVTESFLPRLGGAEFLVHHLAMKTLPGDPALHTRMKQANHSA